MTPHALFAVAPYAAAACLAVLTLIRFATVPGAPSPAELGMMRRVFRGNRLWRLGLLGTLAGHVAVLFLPGMVLRWTATLPRLVAFEVASFACALAAAAGLVAVLAVHLRQQPLRSARSLADGVVLGLLAVAIVSGLGIVVAHRWAASWALVTVTPYLRSVLALRPQLSLVDTLPYLVRLHVFSALACAAVIPLSHALDPLLIALRRALAVVTAPASARARRVRARLQDAARRAAHAFWWQEEQE